MKHTQYSYVILSVIFILFILFSNGSNAIARSPQATNTQENTPDQSVVAIVYYNGKDDLDVLASTLDIWEVNHDQGYLLAMLTPDEYSLLLQSGYQIIIDEEKTALLNRPLVPLPGQGTDTIPGFPCYRTVEQTYQDMQNIILEHPDIASMSDIGDSWDKFKPGGPVGYDILALQLTNPDPQYGLLSTKPTFFLMAEIHAREYVTAETAMRYAEYLVENYDVDPDITWLLNYFRVYIVTMTNPDGRKIAETGNLWRKNVDNDDGCTSPSDWGIDLNRNHSFKWGCCGGSSGYPCAETYRGPSAGSEPEVQAIQNYVLTLFTDQRGPGDNDPALTTTTGTFITLHSFSQLVLWPWGWTDTDAPNHTQLQTLGRHLAFFNNYTPQQSMDLYATDGTSDDWAYGELGIASYTFEMGTDFFQDCGSFENTIYPDNLDALIYAFKTARLPYMNPAGPDSLTIASIPGVVSPGTDVLLTATANDTRFNNSNGSEPTQNITAARYSIDRPSWVAGTATYPMIASDGSFNSKIENIQATIDTSGLPVGRHTIFVESKDANNNWGVTSSVFLLVLQSGVSPVIEGYVREAGTNQPVAASVSAGLFSTSSDPDTGYYSMTVISGNYDMVAIAPGYAPAFAYDVVAQNYQTTQQNFMLYPICTIFSDDVENGNPGNWPTPDYPWTITTETSHSPSHSWSDSPGNYANNRNISLTSKYFDFSDYTGISLSFWQKLVTQESRDIASVEYNTGSGWNSVASYNGFQNLWTHKQVSIPQLDGQPNARIRFHLTTDSNTVYDGWHLDDFVITGGGPSCVSAFPPSADFTSDSPVELGEPIQFTNLTTGTLPITYTWDFGDGVGTSSESDPAYSYLAIGTYTVTLTAENPYGSDSISHPVSVKPVSITSVDLSLLNTDPIYIGDDVILSADLHPDIAAKPYTYTVDFDDGMVITGTSSLDPLTLGPHSFSPSGTYTVQISVINGAMLEPLSDSLDIVVNSSLPVAITSVQLTLQNQGVVHVGDRVYLSADLLPDDASKPYNYIIDFGDGMVITSTSTLDPLPLNDHIYTQQGNFTITIAVWNGGMTYPIIDSLEIYINLYRLFLPLTRK